MSQDFTLQGRTKTHWAWCSIQVIHLVKVRCHSVSYYYRHHGSVLWSCRWMECICCSVLCRVFPALHPSNWYGLGHRYLLGLQVSQRHYFLFVGMRSQMHNLKTNSGILAFTWPLLEVACEFRLFGSMYRRGGFHVLTPARLIFSHDLWRILLLYGSYLGFSAWLITAKLTSTSTFLHV